MNLGENIHNAVVVISKTYENIDKLINYCRNICEKETNYTNSVSKFLRYKSDNDYGGWMIDNFILLFQNKTDRKLKNEWRNGPVFTMEINLADEDVPKVFLSKFEYENINSWDQGCSPANHWAFYWPLRREETMDYEEFSDYTVGKPKPSMEEKVAKDYWGLKRVVYMDKPLTEITSENIKKLIFESFDKLRDI